MDDVQFLLRNSVQDSALLFIDSAQRDYVHHPTPSEYVVDLQEPIRNVFGFEVLDSSIANTMYNIDSINNLLRFVAIDVPDSAVLTAASAAAVSSAASSATATAVTDAVDTAQLAALNTQYFTLGFASPLRTWLADPSFSSYAAAVVSSADYAATPPGAAQASGAAPVPPPAANSGPGTYFYVLVESTLSNILMLSSTATPSLGLNASVTSGGWVAFNGAYYSVVDTSSSATAAAAATLMALGSFALLPSTASGSSAQTTSYTTTAYFDVVTYEAVAMTEADFSAYTGLSVSGSLVSAGGGGRVATAIRVAFSVGAVHIEVGNYTQNTTLQSSLQSALNAAQVPIQVVGTTTAGLNKQAILRLTAPGTCRILISTADSTANAALGIDLHAQTSINTLPRSTRGFGAVAVGGASEPTYSSVYQDDGTQQLTFPGIINLAGVRYVTLRCPEIEEHIGSSGKYGPFSTGIGVFKLQTTNEVVQARADYVNIVRKPFHPIGRLLRMTFRFEMLDGSLFDFKGVNNQLLVSIKYYAPTPGVAGGSGAAAGGASAAAGTSAPLGPEMAVSVLNPDYDPDFHRYVARQSGYAARLDDQGYDPYDEDDEDDEDDDSFRDEEEEEDNDDDGGVEKYVDEGVMRRFEAATQRRVLEAEHNLF